MANTQLYGGGYTGRLLNPEYNRPKVYAALNKRHEAQAKQILEADWNGYKIPIGIRHALEGPLIHVQIVNQYPWAVTWQMSSGMWRRKLFGSLAHAIVWHSKAIQKNPTASIISRQRAYDIPPELRGRIPLPWKWCPRCLKPRKYKRLVDQTFFAEVKVWSEEKQRYIWKVRKLQVMQCPWCRTKNTDPIFRRSNQPWEIKKLKRGARVRTRKHTKQIKRKR